MPTKRADTKTRPLLDPGQDDPFAPFEAWVRSRLRAAKNPLAPASAKIYRSTWKAWIAYLTKHDTSWHEATPQDVERFVAQLPPRSSRMDKASDVTGRRYWRIVKDVYAHARKGNWVEHNPASFATEVPKSERKDALVLAPTFLHLLRRRLPREAAEWQSVRDRALIAVLVDVGPTVAELVELTIDHVSRHGKAGLLTLHLAGERPAQERDLGLSVQASKALGRWLDLRAEMQSSSRHVFIQQVGKRAMSAKTVYLIVRTWLAEHLPAMGLERMQHQGPGALRTAVIYEWLLAGTPVPELLRRCGMDQAQSLRRLAHAAERAIARQERPPAHARGLGAARHP